MGWVPLLFVSFMSITDQAASRLWQERCCASSCALRKFTASHLRMASLPLTSII